MLDKLKDQMFPWRKIEELSETHKKKMALCKLPRENARAGITTCIYIDKHEILAEDMGWEDEETSDYDEENDTHYMPQGWYECIESNVCDYSHYFLTSKQQPTHFMPLDTPEKLAQALRIAVEALEPLSRLGNGEHPGNSDGNVKAQGALKQIEDALK